MIIPTANAVGSEGKVLLTDIDEEVLQMASVNVENNIGLNEHVICKSLDWSDLKKAEMLAGKQTLNHSSVANDGFDIVVASDCLYKDLETAVLLFRVSAAMMRRPSPNSSISSPILSKKEVICSREDAETDEDHPTCRGCGWSSVSALTSSCSHTSIMQPVLILGYTRRLGGGSLDINLMLQAAAAEGFEWCVAEDGVIDVFGNVTCQRTMLWEHCIFLFTFASTNKPG